MNQKPPATSWGPMPRGDLRRSVFIGPQRDVPRDTRIFQPGDPARSLFLVRHGLVALSAEAPNEATLALYGPGEVFGELCFCGERQRFTARAVQPSTIQEAPATQILHLMRTEPSFAGALLETLSNRLRSAQAELHGFVANIVVHAVGTKLLNLSVPATSDDTEWLDLPAAFTHDQLARMVKVRGETLTRVLRRLEALGLIDYSRGDRIQIHSKRMRGFLAGPE